MGQLSEMTSQEYRAQGAHFMVQQIKQLIADGNSSFIEGNAGDKLRFS